MNSTELLALAERVEALPEGGENKIDVLCEIALALPWPPRAKLMQRPLKRAALMQTADLTTVAKATGPAYATGCNNARTR